MMGNCCKDCIPPTRHIGCHATCDTYIKAKEKHEQEKQKIRKEKEGEYAYLRYARDEHTRLLRNTNKNHTHK